MWVWYWPGGRYSRGWGCNLDCWPLVNAQSCNEACMMIPGTYEEMRRDYD